MKKIIISIISCVLFLTTASSVFATESSTPSDGGQTVENEDGIVIKYDENALNGGIDLGMPAKVELSVPFEYSKQYNYNSAASAVMLLNSIGFNYTQQEIADLFNVNSLGLIEGETMVDILNHISEGSRYAFTLEKHDALDIVSLKDHIVEALVYGNPVLMGTLESPGDCYIEGHNQYGILYQYGLVKDYINYGNTVTYIESDYGIYSGFTTNNEINVTNLSYVAGGEWYVW